mmetsp:Transcript_7904/g.15879  ORF Transcript_7904/g.15879 Transcript_7904/m.15879 type:complete len:369 (-) Transcript_7904:102-1208(-)
MIKSQNFIPPCWLNLYISLQQQRRLLEISNDSLGIVRCTAVSSQILGQMLPSGNRSQRRLFNSISMFGQIQMTKHHHTRQQQRCGIRSILAHKIWSSTMDCLHESQPVCPNVSTWRQSQSTNKPRTQIRDNITVQVWHHHHVELGRARNQLHARVVHNHLLILDSWVLLRNLLATFNKKTIRLLHNICLVHSSDLLTSIGHSILECKLGHSVTRLFGNHLERLHNSRHHLMLQSRIFTLCILTNSHQIDIIIPSFIPGNGQTRPNICIQLQLLSQGQIQRSESLPDRCSHWPFQSNFISKHRIQILASNETVCARIDLLANMLLLPFDRGLRCLEDLFHRFSNLRTNTITRKQGCSDRFDSTAVPSAA